MSQKPAQLFRRTKHGLALAPQDVNNTTVNGVRIAEPWKWGTELRMLLACGALPATTSLIAKIQVQQRSDDAWVDLTNASAADVEFTQTDLDDAGAGESATLSGTLDLTYLDGETYKAVRLELTNEVATDAPVCAVYEIFGLYQMEGGDASTLDHFWELQKAL